MDKCRKRMLNDMQLCGYSERTQESYIRAVRQLEDFWGKSPELITDEKVRMMIHVHRGKGAKDRYVPLPQYTPHSAVSGT